MTASDRSLEPRPPLPDPVRPRRRFHRATLTLIALLLGTASAGPARAIDWAISIPRGSHAKGYTPKGTAIVKQGTLYHAFYSMENWEANDPYRLTKRFGHSSSPDLRTWTFLDSAFTVSATGWDRDYIWAPQIVVEGNVFSLFYTGVQMVGGAAVQKTMRATATSLSTTVGGATSWARSDNPVYERAQAPWSNPALPDFRDPFVMPSPYSSGSNSGWLSYHVSHLDPALEITPNPQNYVVGAARAAAGALGMWSDRGPLMSTHYDYQWPPGGAGVRSRLVESPHVVVNDGTYYMFFTGDWLEGTGSVRYLTGTNPLGDAWATTNSWTYRGFVPGLHEWGFNSESFRETYADGTSEDFFFYVQDTEDSWDRYVKVRQIMWTPEEPEPFALADPLRVSQFLAIGGNAWYEGQDATLIIGASHSDSWPRQAPIEVLEVDGALRTPIAPSLIGFPDVITLYGSSGAAWFTPRYFADDDATPGILEIVFRCRGVESATFTIQPLDDQPSRLFMTAERPNYTPKDWAILKVDSLFHAFSIMTNNGSIEPHKEENRFGHFTSPDLRRWTFVGDDAATSLVATPGSWDSDHVWAPSLLERNGVFWMFYTGVKDSVGEIVQRIGAAYTTNRNLTGWTKVSGPVNVCGAPWMNCEYFHFRDPYVLSYPGGAAGGAGWLMYVTTNPKHPETGLPMAEGEFVIGVSRSPGLDDLEHWTDVGPLWATRQFWGGLESPHVLKHGADWHLFLSRAFAGGVRQLKGSDAGGTAWTDLGTLFGGDGNFFASEAVTETYPNGGTEDFFGVVHDHGDFGRHIELYQMEWLADGHFNVFAPLRLDRLDVAPAAPQTVTSGNVATLTLTTGNAAGRTRLAAVELFEVDGTTRTKISPAVAGMPSTVSITSYPVQTVTFNAHHNSDDDATPYRSEYQVRIKGVEATTQLWVQASGGGGGGGGPPHEMEGRPSTALPTELAFRAIGETPVAAGEGLLIELPEASRARLDLFDVRGRRLRRLVDRDLAAGATVEIWDRKDSNGASVGPGVYFARLETRLGARATRVIVIR